MKTLGKYVFTTKEELRKRLDTIRSLEETLELLRNIDGLLLSLSCSKRLDINVFAKDTLAQLEVFRTQLYTEQANLFKGTENDN